VIIDPFVVSAAKVISMSHDLSCILRGDGEMLFWRRLSIFINVRCTRNGRLSASCAVPIAVFRSRR
jgi:hypothetical protein